jgi:perosamine synthetase
MKIPLANPDLGELERSNLLEAFDSGWLTSAGAKHSQFEKEFAASVGVDAALAIGNGTQALHLILLGLGIGPGDRVVVPSLTYVATANAVKYVGAEPVFADIDPDTWCLSPETIERSISRGVKAVIVVHLYGHPAPLADLAEYCRKKKIHLIEDVAEAPFATAQGLKVGTVGVASSYSFYANKILTSGEGGAITSNHGDLISSMRQFRDQGMDKDRRYFFPVIGYNYRMTNIQASIALAQLQRREELISSRLELCSLYSQNLQNLPGITLQKVADWATWSPWLYSVLLDSEGERNHLMSHLDTLGIETRPFFIPIHTLPSYLKSKRSKIMNVTTELAKRGVNIPTWSNMPVEKAQQVIEGIKSFSQGKEKF